jgi:hypothetical protein
MHRVLALMFLILAVVAPPAVAQGQTYKAPRTASGHPDLQGVWNFSSAVPLQRPAAFADREFFTEEEADRHRAAIRNGFATILKFAPVEDVGLDWMDGRPLVEDLRTSLIGYPENGRLPALVEGIRRMPGPEDIIALVGEFKGGAPPPQLASLIAAFQGGKKDSYTDFNPGERCLISAPVPLLPQLDNNYLQIIQGTDHVAIVMDFDRRIVTLDNRAPRDELRRWSGVSSGHWEGDTLVIETRNFSGRGPSFAGAGSGRDKVVRERITRVSANRLEYAATVVDPKTFKDRIELSFPMVLTDAHIYESACHEGNYSLPLALSGARAADETGSAPR